MNKLIINHNSSIHEAMLQMEKSKTGTLLVLNNDYLYLGTLSDGDIEGYTKSKF